jgi:hypothetical protein
MIRDFSNFAPSGESIPASSSQANSRGFADMSLFVARRLAGVAIAAIAIGACSSESSAAPPAQTTAAEQVQQVPAQTAAVAAPPVGTLNGRALPDFT